MNAAGKGGNRFTLAFVKIARIFCAGARIVKHVFSEPAAQQVVEHFAFFSRVYNFSFV